MDFQIDNQNIANSFDSIADYLLTGSVLLVNESELELTEIEFYYFYDKIHEDNYTHSHKRILGEWRFHNQGLDITLQGTDIQDGGVLIRGVKIKDEYINGPIRVVQKIFELFGSVTNCNKIMLKPTKKRKKEIIKTFRHLPNKITYSDFHFKPYRYLIDFDDLSIPSNEKDLIRNKLNCL